MASKYWIKLYHEILDDPKMGQMPDRLWRRTIELFLLAGDVNKEGRLPPAKDIAWRLHLSVDGLSDDLSLLATYGIVHEENGQYIVTKFSERQSAMSGAERSRRYHNSQKHNEYQRVHYGYSNEHRDDTATNRRVDIDIDIDKEEETEEMVAIAKEEKSPSKALGALQKLLDIYDAEGLKGRPIMDRLKRCEPYDNGSDTLLLKAKTEDDGGFLTHHALPYLRRQVVGTGDYTDIKIR